MTDRHPVWRCIGCGRIEGARPCVGICEDRKDEVVFAVDHDRELSRLRGRIESLAAVLRQIAHTTPRKGETDRTWSALQTRARRALEAIESDE